jgi:putative ABC transport system permease protein
MSAFLLQLLSFLRAGARQPAFALLAVVGVALGVCVVTGVERAIDASRRNLANAIEITSGPYSHHVVGGMAGLDEELYRHLRVDLGLRGSLPVVEGTVVLSGLGEALAPTSNGPAPTAGPDGVGSGFPRRARIIGADALAGIGSATRGGLAVVRGSGDNQPLFAEANGVIVSAPFAQALGANTGDTLHLADGEQVVRIVDIIEVPPDQAGAWDGLMLADIATAQDLTAKRGRLTRIDLQLADDDARARVLDALPADAELLTREQRTANLLGISQSFHLNLTALSLLSLLVGAMLIFNTETFLVVRRRRELAILRTLGVTSPAITMLVLTEAALLGLAGSVLGVLAGSALASVMMDLIGRTSQDLYQAASGTLTPMRPLQLMKLLLLGVGISLLAAWLPAREAARGATVEVLRNHDLMHVEQLPWGRTALAGWVAIGAASLLLWLTPGNVVAAFVAMFMILLGLTAQAPLLAQSLFARSRGLAGSLPSLTVRSVGSHLSRSATALAALIVALGTSLGIALMIQSFKVSVVDWLDTVLQADYYVAGNQPGDLTLDRLQALQAMPGVADISTVRFDRISTAEGFDRIVAYDLNRRAENGFHFLAGDAARFFATYRDEDVVMVTETLAYKRGLEVGDDLSLRTATGERRFAVGGIYRDYGSEHGTIAMSEATFGRHFPRPPSVGGAGIYVAAQDADTLADVDARLRAWADGQDGLSLRSRRDLIDISLTVFAQTFTITEVLRVLAALVAFAGTINALLALLLDRYSQFALLRAVGVTPNEIAGMLLAESGLLGLFAGLLAVPVGIVTCLLLIYVVNVRSFGWTMPPVIDAAPLAGTVALAMAAALLAACWPAWRLRRQLAASDLTPRRA